LYRFWFYLFIYCGAETGILEPRPKLLGFHMPGPSACSYTQIKKHGVGRGKRFITGLRTCSVKRQSKHSAHLSAIFIEQT
jgi:hypothetical protein